ncbi:MAG: prepilin-type N-terminal cleavage/methylation domain-containing protein [Holophagales bacterium]|nr:prepilin-type N-terminal cleavage/methylation domain-containing protein [Holophagales bacterium]
MKAARSNRTRRGSSFIEILVSLALLAVVMVGILQMFSLSLLTNLGSAARTDLLYKAQQVVENLRLIYFLQAPDGENNDTARAASGVPANLAVTTAPIYLPYYDGDGSDLTWTYWGPEGFNIVEAERLPYRLSYTVEDPGETFFLVTVTATPVDNPTLLPDAGGPLPALTDADNPRRYMGLGSKLKIVTYSAQIEK